MDAPTTAFGLTVEGRTKTVEVYALGLEQPDNPDARPRAALKALADHLRNFEQNSQLPTVDYKPDRYRGVLFESGPVVGPQVRAWPWPGLTPTDFVAPADPTGMALPRRSMTPPEIAVLRVTEVGGGPGRASIWPDSVVRGVCLRAPASAPGRNELSPRGRRCR